MDWKHFMPSILFMVLGLPLVWQDIKDNSVSLHLLVAIYALWLFSSIFAFQGSGSLAASAIVLLVGALLLAGLPDKLGEADVIFMSGMAALFSFWPLMIALSLGCIASLAAFFLLSRKAGEEVFSQPLPLLPSLYWGGLTVVLGGLRF